MGLLYYLLTILRNTNIGLKAELDGLFQKDSVQSNRLLPIWYKLSYEDVASYSPILASRKGIEAKYFTPAGIAYEFKKLLDEMKQKSVLS